MSHRAHRSDRLPNALLIPATGRRQRQERNKLQGSSFIETSHVISRRSQDNVAVNGGVAEGDQVAAKRPAPEQIRSQR
jgi:hypothetical protein